MLKKFFYSIKEHTVGFLISFFFNICYWIKHVDELSKTKRKIEEINRNVKDIDNVEFFMSKFQWKKEKIDWTPWLITIVNKYMNEIYDDCDGAAVLWCWLFRNCNIETSAWHLRGDNSGHLVAITNDGKFMGTNNSLYKFKNPDNWKKELLNECWNGQYNYCFKNRYI